MAEHEHGEGIIHAKVSISLIATCNYGVNEFEHRKTLLVRDRSTGLLSQVTGRCLIPNKILESPTATLKREWTEETNLSFCFDDGPHLVESILVPKIDHVSFGYIFTAQLPSSLAETLKSPIPVLGDEDVDMVGLYKFKEVVDLLGDWRQKIRHPELNARTLMKWCNSIISLHNSELQGKGRDPLFNDADFGFNFPQVSIGYQPYFL